MGGAEEQMNTIRAGLFAIYSTHSHFLHNRGTMEFGVMAFGLM